MDSGGRILGRDEEGEGVYSYIGVEWSRRRGGFGLGRE